MTPLQARIIYDLNVVPSIDPAEQVRLRIDFIKEYLRTCGAQGLVLGISGGQDSSLAGRLCQLAVEELRAEEYPAEFTAVRLPYNVQADEEDAQLALTFITPDHQVTFNIHRAVDGFEDEYRGPNALAVGTPGQVIDRLRDMQSRGMTYAIHYFPEAAYDRSGLELFEREVIPALQ